ncbi:MAG: metallophosphoesterase family protein [Myxococcales bacterium]
MRVGLVSDTHGRFDEALPRLLAGCDLIVHAGDVVGQEILHQLATIAPVEAVRGNCDTGSNAVGLEDELRLAFGELAVLVLHDAGRLESAPASARAQIVVHGHSHLAGARLVDGVLFVNPGSAGPVRFSQPPTVARLVVDGRHIGFEVLDLRSPGEQQLQSAEFRL